MPPCAPMEPHLGRLHPRRFPSFAKPKPIAPGPRSTLEKPRSGTSKETPTPMTMQSEELRATARVPSSSNCGTASARRPGETARWAPWVHVCQENHADHDDLMEAFVDRLTRRRLMSSRQRTSLSQSRLMKRGIRSTSGTDLELGGKSTHGSQLSGVATDFFKPRFSATARVCRSSCSAASVVQSRMMGD